MNHYDITLTAVVFATQGFVSWPLFMTCIRWLIQWFECENENKKTRKWIHFGSFCFGFIFSLLIEFALSQPFIHALEIKKEDSAFFSLICFLAFLVGFIIYLLFSAFARRFKLKK